MSLKYTPANGFSQSQWWRVFLPEVCRNCVPATLLALSHRFFLWSIPTNCGQSHDQKQTFGLPYRHPDVFDPLLVQIANLTCQRLISRPLCLRFLRRCLQLHQIKAIFTMKYELLRFRLRFFYR